MSGAENKDRLEPNAVFFASHDGDTGPVVKDRCLFGRSQGGQRSSHFSHSGLEASKPWRSLFVGAGGRFGVAAKRLGGNMKQLE